MISVEEAKAELKRRASATIARRAARLHLKDFVLQTAVNYKMGWFHAEVCDALDQFLQDVLDKKSPRLIITAPPRHGKSELVSRRFPAYAFGRDPNLQIIASSYSADLTQRMNRDVQRIIDSEEYQRIFPGTVLGSPSTRAGGQGSYARTSDLFEIVGAKGSYRSTGIGGGITGAGADALIIDDPVKDRADANSPTIRDKTWDWYTSTAYTRLSPGGGVIVMCTRWHLDDLIGRILAEMNQGGEQFRIINYPAVAEHDEEHRKTGEALHPERYSLEQLNRIRTTVGSRDWAALYQQHPVPEGGAVFKTENMRRWNDKTLPPKFDQLIGSWDMTFKDSVSSDFVVGQIWGRKGVDFYLLDLVRGQWDFTKTIDVFTALAEKWPKVSRWLIEDKANGSAIISVLKREMHGITPITPQESKLERAYAVTPMCEAGSVYLPESAPWLIAFEDELTTFPAGVHDDQVDSMTQALNYMRQHKPLMVHPNNLMTLRMMNARR